MSVYMPKRMPARSLMQLSAGRSALYGKHFCGHEERGVGELRRNDQKPERAARALLVDTEGHNAVHLRKGEIQSQFKAASEMKHRGRHARTLTSGT